MLRFPMFWRDDATMWDGRSARNYPKSRGGVTPCYGDGTIPLKHVNRQALDRRCATPARVCSSERQTRVSDTSVRYERQTGGSAMTTWGILKRRVVLATAGALF